MSDQVYLITFSGQDQPGITNRLMRVLHRENVQVLDVGQSVIHDNLSLGFLLNLDRLQGSVEETLEALEVLAKELQLRIRKKPISSENYEKWVGAQGQPRYMITLLGRKITANHLEQVTEVILEQNLNIEKIQRLSGRRSLVKKDEKSHASIEFSVRGKQVDMLRLYRTFLKIGQSSGIDIALQKDDIYRRHRRLVCFDMDSTLIQAEVIDELAKAAGVGKQVSEITERAMNGELNFEESFRQRLALLKGLDASVLEDVAQNLPLTEGLARLTKTLKQVGFKLAILSGGFTYFAEYLQRKFGFDYVYANELEIVDGKVTGQVKGDIVDGEKKAQLLKKMAAENDFHLEQVIAVGDGANDLPMLGLAGLGVAFNAKKVVKEKARHSITSVGLDGILYLLGMSERDLEDA